MSPRGLQLLETHRDELNARFARGTGTLDPGAALAYLQRTVVPILDGWEGEPSAPVLFALFDVGLVGLRAGLVGDTGATGFERALVEHMPRLRTHVERAPAVVLRAIGNGYLQVARECGAEAARGWLTTLAAGADRCADRSALFDLGVVLGWRAGLAEAREAALERAALLDASLLAEVFGAGTAPGRLDPDPVRRFCRPGSASALAPLGLVATTGGFAGFGGPFLRPPRPRVIAGRLVCTDGTTTCEVFADVFGARMRPAGWAHADAIAAAGAQDATVDGELGSVRALGGTYAAPELRGAVAAAACGGMVAVTLQDSHQVLVLGRREAGA